MSAGAQDEGARRQNLQTSPWASLGALSAVTGQPLLLRRHRKTRSTSSQPSHSSANEGGRLGQIWRVLARRVGPRARLRC